MTLTKRLSRRGSQASPRAVRIVARRPSKSSGSPTEAEEPEKAAPVDKEDLPIGFNISEIKFVDDVAQLPIASLTLNVPLIPFKRKPQPPPTPFPFLELPSELRIKIYEYYFEDVDEVLDLDPENYKRYHKLMGFTRICKQIHGEATHLFYSTHSFRIFPTHPARQKHKKPILFRLRPHQRQCLSTLDLRYGPGWGSPPRSWVVNDTLGFKDCINVTQLNVFIECDPSDGIFKGWVRSEGFYERFSRELLAEVISKLPSLQVVQFDAWSSVKKRGGMMTGLMDVVTQSKLMISWGPERGWTDSLDDDDEVKPTRANIWEPLPHTPPSFASNNLLVMA